MPKATSKTDSTLSVTLTPSPLSDPQVWRLLGNLLNKEEGRAFLSHLEQLYQLEAKRILMQRAQPSKRQEEWQTGWDMGRLNLLQLIHDAIEQQHKESERMKKPKTFMQSNQDMATLLNVLRS